MISEECLDCMHAESQPQSSSAVSVCKGQDYHFPFHQESDLVSVLPLLYRAACLGELREPLSKPSGSNLQNRMSLT